MVAGYKPLSLKVPINRVSSSGEKKTMTEIRPLLQLEIKIDYY